MFFVKENLNRPVLEEIFNDFKDSIRNAIKKYGVTTEDPIMSYLIHLEFFEVNENLQQAPTCPRNLLLSIITLIEQK